MKALNFANPPEDLSKRGACTGDDRCTTESYHKPGCPKLAETLAKMKERSK